MKGACFFFRKLIIISSFSFSVLCDNGTETDSFSLRTFTCSNSGTETPEKGVKYVQS